MSQDKDELARRLAAMTEGTAAPEDAHHPSDPHDQLDLATPGAPPTSPPPNAPRMIFPDTGNLPHRATPQPKPFLRPMPPPPSMPEPTPPVSSRPSSPHQVYYTPPTPNRPVATNAPTVADDDAVIVPAPDPTVFAPRHPPRPPVRQQMVQTLAFKRTIIPILLTLGLLCPTLALLGFVVPRTSPLSVLRSGWFAVPFILIGLMNLAFAIVTMLQVKHEVERQTRDPVAPNAR